MAAHTVPGRYGSGATAWMWRSCGAGPQERVQCVPAPLASARLMRQMLGPPIGSPYSPQKRESFAPQHEPSRSVMITVEPLVSVSSGGDQAKCVLLAAGGARHTLAKPADDVARR